PKAYVVHEPINIDHLAYQKAFHNRNYSFKYINEFRKKEIYLRVKNKNIEIYGEVNSLLRRHFDALRMAFPKATFLLLIRNGKDVVRSLMSRETMTKKDPNTRYIYPSENDPYQKKWKDMSRFEKLCWYWQIAYKDLKTKIDKVIKFEKIISSYEYFQKNVLKPLQLEISEEIWRNEIKKPKNATINYTFPHWTKWENHRKKKFDEICGEIMKEFGYY
ncbi:MAG: hypothetical protein ACTSO4_15295, partial [Promethearchaeota archaeon]